MRSSGIAMSSRLSMYSIPRSRSLQQTWSPRHGIHFGTRPSSSDPSSSNSRPLTSNVKPTNIQPPSSTKVVTRQYSSTALQEAEAEAYEANLALHSYAEDAYVLCGRFDSSNSDEPLTPSHAGQSSTGSPSATYEVQPIHDKNEQDFIRYSTEDHPILEFHIPESVLDAAGSTNSSPQVQYWSYKLYSGKDDRKVKIHYCKSKQTAERVLQDYFVDKKVLGFDIEWRPSSNARSGPKANVSLVQLASEDRIVLLHLALFQDDAVEDLVAPSLRRIMEDPDITKVGVSIKSDCTRMRTHLQIESRGIFEISHLYRLVKHTTEGQPELINKKLVSLAAQVEEHLGLPLYKGEEVRGSDWSQPLDMQQLIYAADDSYAGFMLYDTLEAKRKQLRPIPPRPHDAEKGLPIQTAAIWDPLPAKKTSVFNHQCEESTYEDTTQDDLVVPMGSLSIETSDIPNRRLNRSASDIANLDTLSPLRSASNWSVNYQKTQDTARGRQFLAGHAQLRAYALWQHEQLHVQEIASLLRVQKGSAANYILETIRLEKLPYEKERLKTLIAMIPDTVRGTPRGRCYLRLL